MNVPFTVSFAGYQCKCLPEGLPLLYSEYCAHAKLVEEFAIREPEGSTCFLSVTAEGASWPSLVVAQRYEAIGGCDPGLLLLPENERLFLGAGTRLLCYDLSGPTRLWEDYTELGFWGWTLTGDFVIMSAELEIALFTKAGTKLWSHSVEPPWDFTVSGSQMTLRVDGRQTVTFETAIGPADGPVTSHNSM